MLLVQTPGSRHQRPLTGSVCLATKSPPVPDASLGAGEQLVGAARICGHSFSEGVLIRELVAVPASRRPAGSRSGHSGLHRRCRPRSGQQACMSLSRLRRNEPATDCWWLLVTDRTQFAVEGRDHVIVALMKLLMLAADELGIAGEGDIRGHVGLSSQIQGHTRMPR